MFVRINDQDQKMILIFLLIILLIILSIVIWTVINHISPMPTSPKVKKRLLEILPDSMHGTIIELGSGWGTLAVPLAKKYEACRVFGFETSPIPYLYSKIVAIGYTNLHVQRLNFFATPLHDATLVVCYLYPAAMQKLKNKFDLELKPGTLIVSHTFAIPGWTPQKTVEVDDLYKTKIYLYTR